MARQAWQGFRPIFDDFSGASCRVRLLWPCRAQGGFPTRNAEEVSQSGVGTLRASPHIECFWTSSSLGLLASSPQGPLQDFQVGGRFLGEAASPKGGAPCEPRKARCCQGWFRVEVTLEELQALFSPNHHLHFGNWTCTEGSGWFSARWCRGWGAAGGKLLLQWCRLCLAPVPTRGQPHLQSSPTPPAKWSLGLPTSSFPHEGSPSDLHKGVLGKEQPGWWW